MTTAEIALIDEITAHGWVLVDTVESYDPVEDVILVSIIVPVEEDPAAERAAQADAS